MKCVVDVNVLLPLLCGGHPFQEAAWEWFGSRAPGSVGWCLPVRLAVLRHLSNPRIMGTGVLGPEEALEVWDRLALDPRMFEIESVPPELESRLRANVAGRAPTPKLWTDAWLAALAESLGYEMVTFDRGFRQFQLRSLTLLEKKA